MQNHRTPVLEPGQTEAGGNGNGKVHGEEVFRLLAGAVQEHLTSSVDEATVKRIVDEKIAKAVIPQPIEVHLDGHEAKVIEGRQHAQFKELIGLVNEGKITNARALAPGGSLIGGVGADADAAASPMLTTYVGDTAELSAA